MIAQAYALAMKTFAKEIEDCAINMDMEKTAEMAEGIEMCLQALKDLENTLVMFPSATDHDRDEFN
jgi:hypothetical protein